ncbi:hypothetical protein JA1_001526 [Spathaspora sp. JA1]|nr:hypothetical protein JA1_001526 [Spathaspora sp. JA1]
MSNGLCQTTCLNQGKGVAILSGTDCYCSNNVPGDTVDLSKCAIGCPGYKDQENCAGNGFFGYLVTNGPSSTVFQSSSTTSSANNKPSTQQNAPGTTMVTKTTQVTQTDEDNDTVQVTLTVSQTNSQSTTSTSSSQISVQPSTVFSYITVNGTVSQEFKTLYITQNESQSSGSSQSSNANDAQVTPPPTTDPSTDTAEPQNQNKSTFFDDTAKVAGTFTAVGVVVLGVVSGILYCCCIGSRNHNNGDFTDEESQSSAEELSIDHEKQANNRLSNSSLSMQRNSSHKSLFKMFAGDKSGAGVNRSSSRKKLMSKGSPNPNSPDGSNGNSGDSIIMFPINEVDARLDPYTMFLNTNLSKKSLADEHDYSRKLKIANPEISEKEV